MLNMLFGLHPVCDEHHHDRIMWIAQRKKNKMTRPLKQQFISTIHSTLYRKKTVKSADSTRWMRSGWWWIDISFWILFRTFCRSVQKEQRSLTLPHWLIMRNSVNVLSFLVGVEFLLYIVCLCAPQWLVEPGGVCEGLFAICNTYEGFSSCTTFPAWMGEWVMHHIFLFCRHSL